MFVRRLAIAGLLAAASVPAVPVPALAHGAPMTPISRNAACAGNGVKRGVAACKAALEATGGFLGAYDNLRLAGVNGNDRERVPDGKLCSGGIDAYRGLDLARDDFPATEVRPGQRLAVSYRGTIPHQGSFRIYLTRPGYAPTEKLGWDDLGAKPLVDVKDPPLTGGAYRMRVKLPERTGRHILYVVWETSSTPDTYYSCSDLVFPAAKPQESPQPEKSTKPKKAAVKTTAASPSPPPSSSVAPVQAAAEEPAEPAGNGTITLGHWLIVGALAAAALVAAGAGVSRLRRRGNR